MVDSPPKFTAQQIAHCVERVRATKPHVHCITNSVAQHFTANVLLAAGATPSMTIAVEEIADFVTMADALLVNLGTMDAERTKAVQVAVETARSGNKPWALDPVFVQASPIRLGLARRLLSNTPTLVRCNGGEFRALFERDVSDLELQDFSPETTIALTGSQDVIVNSSGVVRVNNGSEQMDRVTTMGCALTALAVGFQATEENPLLAITAALTFFALAGEHAEQASAGPGTFVPHFLDALANLTLQDIEKGANLS